MRIPLVRSGGDDTPIAWWEWLFSPLMIMFVFFVGGVLALISIPYFALYPERHAHEWDFDDNATHQRLLARWRARYARLTLGGRVRRSWMRFRRRLRHPG